jgi:hypothetical protein
VHNEKFMLSDLPDYYIGEEGDLKHYKEVSSPRLLCICEDNFSFLLGARTSLALELLVGG